MMRILLNLMIIAALFSAMACVDSGTTVPQETAGSAESGESGGDATAQGCGPCQYTRLGVCVSYNCCSDEDCGDGETCVNAGSVESYCREFQDGEGGEDEEEEPLVECDYCQYFEYGECRDAACCEDSDCDDGEPSTNDACVSPWTKNAHCEYVEECEYECCSDSDCDDGDSVTEDECVDGGAPYSYCVHIKDGSLQVSEGTPFILKTTIGLERAYVTDAFLYIELEEASESSVTFRAEDYSGTGCEYTAPASLGSTFLEVLGYKLVVIESGLGRAKLNVIQPSAVLASLSYRESESSGEWTERFPYVGVDEVIAISIGDLTYYVKLENLSGAWGSGDVCSIHAEFEVTCPDESKESLYLDTRENPEDDACEGLSLRFNHAEAI
jgi:hypothetical protein